MRGTCLLITSLALALTLSGCGKPAGYAESASSADAASTSPGTGPQAPARAAISIPQLAYVYVYALSAPAKAIRSMVSRHEAACVQAGPQVCQITGASVNAAGDDQINGTLTLRATSAWIAQFRGGLAAEAKAAGGRIVNSSVTSEDLSRQIVDTEAAIRARSVLRDRLENLLATRPGKLSELLELERELARTQGQLDADRSELAMMRARVATSELRLTYRSADVMMSLVRVAPWALIVAGVVWFFRRRLVNLKKAEQLAA